MIAPLSLMMLPSIETRMDEISALCRSHKVRSIALFGSAAKGELTAGSDVDILVEFNDDLELLAYADNYFSLLEGLEKILGSTVDLVSIRSIRNPILKEEIERTKIALYAA